MYEEGNYVDNLISNNAIEQEQKEMTDLLALHFRDTNRNTEEYRSYTDLAGYHSERLDRSRRKKRNLSAV